MLKKIEGMDELEEEMLERSEMVNKIQELFDKYKDQPNALELIMADLGIRHRPRQVPLMETEEEAQEVLDINAESNSDEGIFMALCIEAIADALAGE
jgi:hypothetical protein